MVDYRYMLVEASTGDNIAEVPLNVQSFSYGINNNPGQMVATLPLDDPTAAEANWEGDREVTVLRNDAPVWRGPLTNVPISNRRGGVLNCVFREPTWYFQKRVLEQDMSWTSADIFDIFRDLVTYATSKTATGADGMTAAADLVAAIPRFSVASGLAGETRSLTFSGASRYKISDLLNVLVSASGSDPALDYRADYSTGSTRDSCHCTITLGSPTLGVTQTVEITEDMLYDYSRSFDYEQAAGRVHVLGGNSLVKTLQNSGSVSDGLILLEEVFSASELTVQADVDAYAREARRLYQPPIHDRSSTFVPSDLPGAVLPWGWCALGDVIPYRISGPGILQITAQHRRLVEITVTPPGPQGADELVALRTNLVTDLLGS